jgi:hypothetical protein
MGNHRVVWWLWQCTECGVVGRKPSNHFTAASYGKKHVKTVHNDRDVEIVFIRLGG